MGWGGGGDAKEIAVILRDEVDVDVNISEWHEHKEAQGSRERFFIIYRERARGGIDGGFCRGVRFSLVLAPAAEKYAKGTPRI